MMASLIALLTSVAAVSSVESTTPSLQSLLHSMPNISEFASLLGSSPYSTLLQYLSSQRGSPVTILVPNDTAFAKLPHSSLGIAFENNDTHVIQDILEYHVLQDIHSAETLNGTFEFLPTWLSDTPITGGQVVGAVQQSEGVSIITSGLGERTTLLDTVSLYHQHLHNYQSRI